MQIFDVLTANSDIGFVLASGCKVVGELHSQPGFRTVIMKGREYRGYMHVDAKAVKTKGELEYWVGLALDYNSKAKASIKKRKR